MPCVLWLGNFSFTLRKDIELEGSENRGLGKVYGPETDGVKW
jgi:hypothetical protein